MSELKPQRRGGRISMTPAERDAFLTQARTGRVGTTDADGNAHVSALWLHSVVKSQR